MDKYIRDTSFGQLVRTITRNQVLQYPEEQGDFQLPEAYVKLLQAADLRSKNGSSSASEQNDVSGSEEHGASTDLNALEKEAPAEVDEASSPHDDPSKPKVLDDGTIIVDWYGPNDPANPQNWTTIQKVIPAGIVNMYTFAVYLGSSIITGSFGDMMQRFDVSQQVVSLTLSMYVLAYGLGPLLWSPLTEIPSIGRNSLYVITFALFVILLVPTALADDFAGLVVARFLLGFFGSPCLATGPATMGDLFGFDKLPYALATWALVATSGKKFIGWDMTSMRTDCLFQVLLSDLCWLAIAYRPRIGDGLPGRCFGSVVHCSSYSSFSCPRLPLRRFFVGALSDCVHVLDSPA